MSLKELLKWTRTYHLKYLEEQQISEEEFNALDKAFKENRVSTIIDELKAEKG